MGTGADPVNTRSVHKAMLQVMRKLEDSHPLPRERAIETHSQEKTKKKKGGMVDVLRQMRLWAPTTLGNELKTYLAAPLAGEECDI